MARYSADFGALVREILGELSHVKAARRLRLSQEYVRRMATEGQVPSDEIVRRFAEEFAPTRLTDLMIAAGKWQPSTAYEAVEECLGTAVNVPEEGKQEILKFVRKIEGKYGLSDNRSAA